MLIHRARKESIPDIVKRFNVPPLEVIPHKEFAKEEIEEADTKFVKKLIEIFMDVKNKAKV